MPFYYPNWINDFWRIMGLIHFADKNHFCIPGEKRFDEAAIRAFCEKEGLAFYDTATEVRRLKDNASDAFLEVVQATDIPSLLAQIPDCRALVTTGEKASSLAAAAFGCDIPPVGGYIDLVIPGFDLVIASLLAHALLLPRVSPAAGEKGRCLSASILSDWLLTHYYSGTSL